MGASQLEVRPWRRDLSSLRQTIAGMPLNKKEKIGQAMRVALVEGFHRALPVDQLGRRLVDRCSNIWWTVYILDRKFSSLQGSPNSVNDEDITTALWDARSGSDKEAALSLHVKISQVITRVLNSGCLSLSVDAHS